MQKYDVIIIGGACAGLSAALYTARRALKTIVLTRDLGGQAAITTEIENYPGVVSVLGPELMNRFKEQAEKAGAEIRLTQVSSIVKEGDEYVVSDGVEQYQAPALILAFGLTHRTLNVPGEKELTGRGVAYCATCDGPLFKNKIVAVVGGGNSALEATDYLSDICQKVYMFVRADKFRADEVGMLEQVKNKANVEIRFNTSITEVIGERKVEKVKLNDGSELELNGVFVEIGYATQTEFLHNLVELDARGQIIVDQEAKTSSPGIFAAGDVTNIPFKQAVISAGDGAKSALSASRYVKKLKGLEDKPDWNR
ncbi:MAG: glucose-inhibited division protein A [Parcubacteria group bacterium GW2011_GWC2_39_14]|nr:MAG: glucose-inhibited division protein A [Parcubacteria group bacterium GW2011_GWC2_39_14]KKR53399.1 MAG: glucose-inhibited division protein A [Parcubacteria group bacterium GW2011_GWA2_40_23]